jgi:hypothetical protein
VAFRIVETADGDLEQPSAVADRDRGDGLASWCGLKR